MELKIINEEDDGKIVDIQLELSNGTMFYISEEYGMLKILSPEYRKDGLRIKPSAPNVILVESPE